MQNNKRALISGSAEWVDALTHPLEAQGFDVVAVDGLPEATERCAEWSLGSVACYIQAPFDWPDGAGHGSKRLGNFLKRGLVRRFQLAAHVGPLLQRDGTVILVPGPEAAEDRFDEGFNVLRVVADAVEAEHPGVRVFVAGAQCSASEVAVLAAGARRRSAISAYGAGTDPQLGYVEWRDTLLSCLDAPNWPGGVSVA